jgi:hypothetical protein
MYLNKKHYYLLVSHHVIDYGLVGVDNLWIPEAKYNDAVIATHTFTKGKSSSKNLPRFTAKWYHSSHSALSTLKTPSYPPVSGN